MLTDKQIKPEDKKEKKAKEYDPIKEGKKIIEIEKKTDGKPDKESERDHLKDAENWRNEG